MEILTKLDIFKNEVEKSGMDFDFVIEPVKMKTEININEYDLVKLFSVTDGLTFYVNQDVTYMITTPGFDEIKVRSIPHLIKILKSVYMQHQNMYN